MISKPFKSELKHRGSLILSSYSICLKKKKSLYDIIPKRYEITCIKLHDLGKVEFVMVFHYL